MLSAPQACPTLHGPTRLLVLGVPHQAPRPRGSPGESRLSAAPPGSSSSGFPTRLLVLGLPTRLLARGFPRRECWSGAIDLSDPESDLGLLHCMRCFPSEPPGKRGEKQKQAGQAGSRPRLGEAEAWDGAELINTQVWITYQCSKSITVY